MIEILDTMWVCDPSAHLLCGCDGGMYSCSCVRRPDSAECGNCGAAMLLINVDTGATLSASVPS